MGVEGWRGGGRVGSEWGEGAMGLDWGGEGKGGVGSARVLRGGKGDSGRGVAQKQAF